MYYGNHPGAKKVAARLIRDAGFDPVDAGPLRMGRYASRSRCWSPSSHTKAIEARSSPDRLEWFRGR